MSVEISETYQEDLREKHALKNNARTSRVSRSGRNLRFAFENMPLKERRAYTKPSEVRVSNMYEKILPREDFDALENEQKKIALAHWKQKYTLKELTKALSMSSNTVYVLMDQLGIDRDKRKGKQKKTTNNNQTVNVITHTPEQPKEKPKLTNGLNLIYNGHKTPEEINAILLSFASMLESQNGKFEIELRISEK